MPTEVKVKKWGSSMALLLPSHFAKARHINVGSLVDIDGMKVVGRRKRPKFSEFMAQRKREPRRGEWDLGQPVGKEIW